MYALTFGTRHLIIVSDWSVCLVAGDYTDVTGLVSDYFKQFSDDGKADVFGNVAVKVYGLKKSGI